ncbi:hypothetical protein H7Y63_00190 [Polaromonas sp.]|nr:hypothetical protein [Candidatus Saccharibacteria bacterium]
MYTLWRATLLALLITVATTCVGGPIALAATAKPSTEKSAAAAPANISQSLSHSYNADPAVQLGMIVKLKPKDTGTVELVTQDTIKSLLGVVVQPNESTITLTPQTTTVQQVYVATKGHFSVLVSNQNGPIKVGDIVTVSAIAGIGMKADDKQLIVLGKALTAFNGTNNVVGKVALKNQLGKSTDVSISRVSVAIDISHNPLASQATDKVPEFLSKAAIGLVDKPVSAARIYLGVVILVVSAFVAANLVYSGVRNGMVSIGRNPLSKKSIIKSLIQTVIAGLIVFIVGVLAVYLLLKA